MFYIILILTLFSVALLIRRFRSTYTWIVAMMVLGIDLAIFSLILFVAKIGNYSYISNPLLNMDYRLFLFINQRIRIGIFDILTLMLCGIVIYLVAVPFLAQLYRPGLRDERRLARHDLISGALMLLYPVLFFLFYLPQTGYAIYLYYHVQAASNRAQAVINLVGLLDKVFTWTMIFYLLYPLMRLTRYYRRVRAVPLKKHVIVIGLNFSLFTLIFYYLFFLSQFRFSYENLFEQGIFLSLESVTVPKYQLTIFPLAILLVFQVIFLLMQRFFIGNPVRTLYTYYIRRRSRAITGNIRDALHSQKNILFSVKILSERIETLYGEPEGRRAVEELKDLSISNIDLVSRALEALREVRPVLQRFNLIESIEDAAARVVFPSDVTCIRNYCADQIPVHADRMHLTEVFVNLLQNSLEAILIAGRSKGRIVINVEYEDKWIFIRIIDNGAGIPKSELNNIVMPFYSAKSKQKNWGLGLTYVVDVVRLHLGKFWMESTEGECASANMLLPDTVRHK